MASTQDIERASQKRVAFIVANEAGEHGQLGKPWVARASWADREVAVCKSAPGPVICSRKADDLSAFSSELLYTIFSGMRT